MSDRAVRREGDVCHVGGLIGESSDLTPALAGAGPIRLNFRGVTSISSVGATIFLEFISRWNGRKVTYEECPPALVDAFLMLPALLGPEENTATIVSMYVPFQCHPCKESMSLLVRADEIGLKADRLILPARHCTRCARDLEPYPIVEDYLALVEFGALKPATK